MDRNTEIGGKGNKYVPSFALSSKKMLSEMPEWKESGENKKVVYKRTI